MAILRTPFLLPEVVSDDRAWKDEQVGFLRRILAIHDCGVHFPPIRCIQERISGLEIERV